MGGGGCEGALKGARLGDVNFGEVNGFEGNVVGEEEAAPSLGYMFETNEENLRRWRGWWA